MTYQCLLQMVLLLCLSTTALCRSYSLLRFQQGRSLEVCQNLLWQLPSTPQHCLEFRMDFQMPEEMKQAQQFRKEDAVLVMYEMLQHIFNILTRDFSSTGWSDTIIEHLREELYGQMNRLEPIQKEIMQKQTSTMGDTTDLHLRKYYFTLGQYLKSKEHNSKNDRSTACALSRSPGEAGGLRVHLSALSHRFAVLARPLPAVSRSTDILYGPHPLAGGRSCCIPACSLRWNEPGIHRQKHREIFKHLKQMQRIRSQSRLKDKADFRFPRKREMITPVQMTQGPCNHYLMLQQSFQLFTTEDSRATLQPGSEPETTGAHGRRQSVQFSRDFLPGSISRASISIQELEYSHFA
ncbi:hypothetical protein MJG53_003279 [Ovis ammon polii x Ovis aries]|uniref:Antiluteolysin n=2 Tax=Ovis TaxID=9935 RepID=A0A836D6N4_SHEEP|nr:hypothetical protein JEQ12_009226 [Ovis aries]KAI4588871.1 hypothetical protein MJG53_003279 [Ovis ammon polii x Ovis aries]